MHVQWTNACMPMFAAEQCIIYLCIAAKLHQLKGNLEAADQVFARVVQFPPHDQLDLNHVIRERISKFITCITILSEAVSELSNY